MAELADAHGSGPCESNFMQVQLLLPAPKGSIRRQMEVSFFVLPVLERTSQYPAVAVYFVPSDSVLWMKYGIPFRARQDSTV